MQAGGHRFDPDRLHQRHDHDFQDETKADPASAGQAISIAVFDIVNGFLIDAVPHYAAGLRTCGSMRHFTDVISG